MDLTAKEAKKLAEEKSKKDLNPILEKIKTHAEAGEYSVVVDSINDIVRVKLEELGYSIKYISAGPRVYVNSYYIISW